MKSISQNNRDLERQIKKLNIEAKFNDSKVTSVGTFIYMELFKKIIGLSTILKKSVAYEKGANSVFAVSGIIEYLIDANILGYSRLNHTEDLRKDVGYKKIKESVRIPSEKVCRDLLLKKRLDLLLEQMNF